MKFSDVKIEGVTRNKFSELVFKCKVKPEDYDIADYEDLHNMWEQTIVSDVTVGTSTSIINPSTGEVTQ